MNEFDFLSMVYYNEVVAKEERITSLCRLADRYGLDWVLANYPDLTAEEIREISGRCF